MGMDIMMVLLAASAALTGLVTEAVKKMIGEKQYSVNVLAAIVSVIVAGGVCAWYIIMHDVVVDTKVWTQIVALVVLSWLCAMTSYDKVRQTIAQIMHKEDQ